MTTWTPKTENSSSWTAEVLATRVFDPAVFSHAFVGDQRVFAIGSSQGVWDADSAPLTTWTPE
jgi:hypothetical protein